MRLLMKSCVRVDDLRAAAESDLNPGTIDMSATTPKRKPEPDAQET